MDNRELRLNSLSRYTKRSPLFILEEYGHCEVPAGCGGVVLRWRDPRAGIPLTTWLYACGESQVLLDGVPPTSGRPVVPYGEHVFAFVVSAVEPAYTVLRFAALHGPERGTNVRSTPAWAAQISVLTGDDGGWRYSSTEPADDGWLHPGFDDRGWLPMEPRAERRPPPEGGRDPDGYQVNRLTELGAAGLGVSGVADRVWIRRPFRIAEPSESPSGGGAGAG